MLTESTDISPIELLQFYVDSGADEAMTDAAIDRTKLAPPVVSAFPQPAKPSAATMPVSLPTAAEAAPATTPGAFEALGDARLLAAEAKSLEALKAALEGFNALTLKRTATNMVFADGNPAARIMIVGEKPGPDEDRLGRPFAGQQGQLLDKMLAAIGLSREENVYITNIVNWRPPGDRNPTEAELALSLPFIHRHIELVNPAVLVFLGGAVTKVLMPGSAALMRLRGKWAEHKTEGLEKPVPVMPLFHPEYLLKSPLEKRVAWADLLKLKEKLGQLGL
ncbi:MAG: uracil-DNA glycosylase family protein [Alphaproteobacteria bacterium]